MKLIFTKIKVKISANDNFEFADNRIVDISYSLSDIERANTLSVTFLDPNNEVGNKLWEQFKAEGGIRTPQGLLEELNINDQGEEANITDGLKGDQLATAIIAACKPNGVTDKCHIAYILATIDHESKMGVYSEEIASGSAYEGRSDLGNTEIGDGVKFKGRGLVQVTGRRNYTYWANRLNIDCVNDPKLLSQLKYAIPIAILGMKEGVFTGTKLSDYGSHPGYDYYNARKIINGLDRADHIAGLARKWINRLDSLIAERPIASTNTAIANTNNRVVTDALLSNQSDEAKLRGVSVNRDLDLAGFVAVNSIELGYPIEVIIDYNDTTRSIQFYLTDIEIEENILAISGQSIEAVINRESTSQTTRSIENTSLRQMAIKVAEQFKLKTEIPNNAIINDNIAELRIYQGESLLAALNRSARLKYHSARIEGDTLRLEPIVRDDIPVYVINSKSIIKPLTFSEAASTDRVLRPLPVIDPGTAKLSELSNRIIKAGGNVDDLNRNIELNRKLQLLANTKPTEVNTDQVFFTEVGSDQNLELGEGFKVKTELILDQELLDLPPGSLINISDAGTKSGVYKIRSIRHNPIKGTTILEGYLPVWSKKKQTEDKKTSLSGGSRKANEVIAIARSYIGQRFNGDAFAQCCVFVRHVFSKAGIELGVTSNPLDNILPTGLELANSLYGTNIGTVITLDNVLPGDLVFFGGTYGDYPSTTVTHIGIATGNGNMIDRSTSSKPIEERPLTTFPYFVGAIRVNGLIN